LRSRSAPRLARIKRRPRGVAACSSPEQAVLSRILEIAVSLLVLTFVFALLYKYVPDAEIGWRDVWLGGFITAVLFTLGKTAIGIYLGRASVGQPTARRIDGGAPCVGLLLA